MANLLPQVVIILAVAVYIILFVQLRSAFTPLRLIFTILCSVAFALAILAAIFYYGSNLPILDFAPLFVVVTMLGVGIDYDIFFVTRIREEALKGNSDDEAIKTAVEKVWITILGLGLVLATVFASLTHNWHCHPARNCFSRFSCNCNRCSRGYPLLRALTDGIGTKTELVAAQNLKSNPKRRLKEEENDKWKVTFFFFQLL